MLKHKVFSFLALLLIIPAVGHADEFSQLQQQLLLLIQQVTRLQGDFTNLQRISNISCKTLEKNLGLGDKGDDVAFLQNSLIREGFDLGQEKGTHVYGDITASAVSGFQQKYKSEVLMPAGLSYGTGFAGKATRAKLNSIYGCGAKAPDLSQRPIVLAPSSLSIQSPQPGQTLTTSTKVVGTINSDGWITPSGDMGLATLFDSTGRQLYQGTLVARSDKKTMPVSFDVTLNTNTPRTEFGYILFASKSTSSLLATGLKEFRLPVKFPNVSSGAIKILFPQEHQQLLANNKYTFTWSGSSGNVSLLLIHNALELSGGKAVVWRVDNLSANGSYNVTIPAGSSGSYRLFVSDSGGRFGLSPYFYIGGSTAGIGQIPHVVNVQGPQSLQVNQAGTWTVGAVDPENGLIDFTVDWGDGTSGRPGVSGSGAIQSATFAHSYKVNGTYMQIYRVTDPSGLSDQYAYQVQVGSASAPTITSMSPTSGPIGTTVTITGTRFNTINNIVNFGSGQLTGIPSSDGKTLRFTIQQDQVGSYDVSVLSGSGRTNSVTFSVIAPPTCSNLSTPGTNQFTGCFWKWRNQGVIPSSADDGILAGETVPAQPGFIAPVPSTATAIDINWAGSVIANSFIGGDYYTARWKGNFTFDPGTYRFTVGSDDGVRIYFDDVLKLDRWGLRSYTEDSFEVTFPVRTTTKIQLDYMEGWYTARIKSGWIKL